MKPIVDASTMEHWITVSESLQDKPFENSFGANFSSFAFTDYTALFLSETIKAACAWSAEHELEPFAMFFTIPEPLDYFSETGFYGGLVATGEDVPKAIVSYLTDDNRWSGHFSVYDASHRFIVVPASRRWMFLGDRDADLAIFGFESSSQKASFLKTADIVTFDSAEDAAEHARSFMRYSLNISLFQ